MPDTDGMASAATNEEASMGGDEPSVHDNVVLGYEVLCAEREIRLRTLYPDQEPPEQTDVRFTGVLAYHFDHALMNTSLFDIEEVSLQRVYDMFADVFLRSKNYGWPIASYSGPEDLLARLRAHGVRAFVVSSSYGMNGFVLAEAMAKVRRGSNGVQVGP